MGTDARVRYTKKMIRDTFLALLREKSVKQITVTELCRLAEINRATFYKYYRDVYDLLEQMEADALEHLRETARRLQTDNAAEHFVRLLESAREHHVEYAVIGSDHGDPHFSQKVSACLFEESRETIFRQLPNLPDEERQMVCRFLEGGGTGTLARWMETGMEQQPESVARLIFRLSNAAMKFLLL